MKRPTRSIGCLGVLPLLLALAACGDADTDADDAPGAERPGAPGDSALFGDTAVTGGVLLPGEDGLDPIGGGDINATDAQAPGTTSGATAPAGPGGPAGSSARDGAGPPGGDDLGRGRDVGAPAPATDAILTRAAAAYAAVRTMRAQFEQSTENPVLGRTTTSRGTMYQARPDRFLMRFSQPEGDRIVSDGTYIWAYYPSVDERQVIRMRAGAAGAGGVDLQAQFLGDPTTRFDATLVGEESVGGRPADVLVMVPRGSGAFRSLKVWVDRRDSLVRRFEITEHNGVIRRFLLRDLTPGADLDDALFRFTPPEGAHVVARG